MDVAALSAMDPTQRAMELERSAGTLVKVQHVLATEAPDGFNRFSIGPLKVSSVWAAFPAGIDTGTCLESITGVIEYANGYVLVVRSTAEVVIGSGCN
jgi:hypothetical protein